jgi:hypothetical protein
MAVLCLPVSVLYRCARRSLITPHARFVHAYFSMLTPCRLSLYSVGSSADGPNSHTFAVVAVIHAAITLVPTIWDTLSSPSNSVWGPRLSPFLVNLTGVVVMPMCLMLQFIAQFRMLRSQDGDLNSISLLSWYLQIPVLAAVAFRWVCRTGLPPWVPPEPYGPHFRLWLWDIVCCYYVHCMMSVNCLIWACEMYLLVAYCLWMGWEGRTVEISISGS